MFVLPSQTQAPFPGKQGFQNPEVFQQVSLCFPSPPPPHPSLSFFVSRPIFHADKPLKIPFLCLPFSSIEMLAMQATMKTLDLLFSSTRAGFKTAGISVDNLGVVSVWSYNSALHFYLI